MTLTQAEMEAKYDSERTGAIYLKPATHCDRCGSVITDDQIAIAREADRLIAADESEDTDAIASILEDMDGGERRRIDERMDTVVDQLFGLPDAQRAQAIGWLEGFVAGVGAAG
jgi:hypothetical protein